MDLLFKRAAETDKNKKGSAYVLVNTEMVAGNLVLFVNQYFEQGQLASIDTVNLKRQVTDVKEALR